MHLRFGEKSKWVLDQTTIFAQVDAFVQRCKDLLEVGAENTLKWNQGLFQCKSHIGHGRLIMLFILAHHT